jgi:hypothetical protein
MEKKNLFKKLSKAMYDGESIEFDQRYRANSLFVVSEIRQNLAAGTLTDEYCFEIGNKIDALCEDAYGQGLVDGIDLGRGMEKHSRQAQDELTRDS